MDTLGNAKLESVTAGIYYSQAFIIYFCRGFSCCPYYRGVRYSKVSARRELPVYVYHFSNHYKTNCILKIFHSASILAGFQTATGVSLTCSRTFWEAGFICTKFGLLFAYFWLVTKFSNFFGCPRDLRKALLFCNWSTRIGRSSDTSVTTLMCSRNSYWKVKNR